MGHSAGAHIASLLATDPRWLQAEGMRPLQLCGMIGLAGAYDFLPSTDERLHRIFGSTPEQHRLSLPMTFADGDEPPVLLLHGASDRIVPARESIALQEALQRAGGLVTLKIYPGVGHSRINLALMRLNDGRSPTLADSLEFIRGCQPRLTPTVARRQSSVGRTGANGFTVR
jgi:acetyl esterase/lipase